MQACHSHSKSTLGDKAGLINFFWRLMTADYLANAGIENINRLKRLAVRKKMLGQFN